jgi:hypothetical protein
VAKRYTGYCSKARVAYENLVHMRLRRHVAKVWAPFRTTYRYVEAPLDGFVDYCSDEFKSAWWPYQTPLAAASRPGRAINGRMLRIAMGRNVFPTAGAGSSWVRRSWCFSSGGLRTGPAAGDVLAKEQSCGCELVRFKHRIQFMPADSAVGIYGRTRQATLYLYVLA